MQDITSKTARNESGLIQSIQDSADDKIRAIKIKFARDTENLRQLHEKEIRDIQKKQENDIEVKIKQEITRITNRALIEKQKLKLNILESFCEIMIREATKDLKISYWTRYKEFLVKAAFEALKNISHNHARITFCSKDDNYQEIQKEIVQQFNDNTALIFESRDPGTGIGLIIEDLDNGIIYNASIERIIHRKQDQLRKAVIDAISEKI